MGGVCIAELSRACRKASHEQELTRVVLHDVGIDHIATLAELVLQVLPGSLPGQVTDICPTPDAHRLVSGNRLCHLCYVQTYHCTTGPTTTADAGPCCSFILALSRPSRVWHVLIILQITCHACHTGAAWLCQPLRSWGASQSWASTLYCILLNILLNKIEDASARYAASYPAPVTRPSVTPMAAGARVFFRLVLHGLWSLLDSKHSSV